MKANNAAAFITMESLRHYLGFGDEATPWLYDLEAVGAPGEAVPLPRSKDTPELLMRLGVPEALIPEVVAGKPSPERNSELWWLLERCHQVLVKDMGGTEPLRRWPSLPAPLGLAGRYLYVWVFLATLGAIQQYHASRGISVNVSWATLGDLGRHVVEHLRLHGEGGLSGQDWLTLHWRGGIYQLGRLQFNRGRIYYDDAMIASHGAPFRHGDRALGIHIPEIGPLTPEACDDALRQAREFFPRHFSEEEYRVATCGSWLLDPQLAEYLSDTSNIIRFQRRFHVMPVSWPSDQDNIRYVFGRMTTTLDGLPQQTTLQRAIVQHLRAGRHWVGRSGWLEL
jgi:hypothetical protein